MPQILIINSVEDCNLPSVLQWFGCQVHALYEQLAADDADIAIIDTNAYPDTLRTYIDNHPEIERIYAFGHGLPSSFTVNQCLDFITTHQNLEVTNQRVVHLLSCLTAQELGIVIINTGAATAYFGYNKEVFMFVEDTSAPCSCRFQKASCVGDIELELSLYKKRPFEQCLNDAITRWNNEIRYWEEHYDEESVLTSSGTTIPITEDIALMLIDIIIHNRNALVGYESDGVLPTPTTSPLVPILLLSGAALGGMIITSKPHIQ